MHNNNKNKYIVSLHKCTVSDIVSRTKDETVGGDDDKKNRKRENCQ